MADQETAIERQARLKKELADSEAAVAKERAALKAETPEALREILKESMLARKGSDTERKRRGGGGHRGRGFVTKLKASAAAGVDYMGEEKMAEVTLAEIKAALKCLENTDDSYKIHDRNQAVIGKLQTLLSLADREDIALFKSPASQEELLEMDRALKTMESMYSHDYYVGWNGWDQAHITQLRNLSNQISGNFEKIGRLEAGYAQAQQDATAEVEAEKQSAIALAAAQEEVATLKAAVATSTTSGEFNAAAPGDLDDQVTTLTNQFTKFNAITPESLGLTTVSIGKSPAFDLSGITTAQDKARYFTDEQLEAAMDKDTIRIVDEPMANKTKITTSGYTTVLRAQTDDGAPLYRDKQVIEVDHTDGGQIIFEQLEGQKIVEAQNLIGGTGVAFTLQSGNEDPITLIVAGDITADDILITPTDNIKISGSADDLNHAGGHIEITSSSSLADQQTYLAAMATRSDLDTDIDQRVSTAVATAANADGDATLSDAEKTGLLSLKGVDQLTGRFETAIKTYEAETTAPDTPEVETAPVGPGMGSSN